MVGSTRGFDHVAVGCRQQWKADYRKKKLPPDLRDLFDRLRLEMESGTYPVQLPEPTQRLALKPRA
jgi:hypothetical protein